MANLNFFEMVGTGGTPIFKYHASDGNVYEEHPYCSTVFSHFSHKVEYASTTITPFLYVPKNTEINRVELDSFDVAYKLHIVVNIPYKFKNKFKIEGLKDNDQVRFVYSIANEFNWFRLN